MAAVGADPDEVCRRLAWPPRRLTNMFRGTWSPMPRTTERFVRALDVGPAADELADWVRRGEVAR